MLTFVDRGAARIARRRPEGSRAWLSGSAVLDPTIGLSAAQIELYKTAVRFSEAEFKPHAHHWDETNTFPRSLMAECGKLGYGGMLVPKDLGGAGLSRLDTVIVIEALARHCVGTTSMLTIHNAVTNIVGKFSQPQHRRAWTSALCSMDWMGSFCLTEPGSGSDAASIVTAVTLDEDSQEYVINGQKCFISGAGMSEIYLVMCRNPAGKINCIAVPKGTPGLTFGAKEKKMGWRSQPTRQVFFDNVRVPASHRIGEEGHGFRIAMAGLDGGRLSIAACSIGAAQTCLEIALEHCKSTGRSTGDDVQQSQMFRLADMAGKISQARVLLRSAAQQLDSQSSVATTDCAMAKLISTDLASEVCADALLLLEQAGLSRQVPVERLLRDLRVHQILEGTNEIMRFLLGRSIVA